MNRLERDELIEENMGLVYMAAHKYFKKTSSKYEFDELVSIGAISLIKSVETFDENIGVKFNSYAGKNIDFAIKLFTHRDTRYFHRKVIDGKDQYFHTDISTLNIIGSEESKEEIINLIADVFTWGEIDSIMDAEYGLKIMLSVLNDREKVITIDYYLNDVSQTALAKRYGISQAHMSRTITKIKNKILSNEAYLQLRESVKV